MRIEIVSELKLPSGHDPGVDVSILGVPITKGDGKQATQVKILDPLVAQRVRARREIPVGHRRRRSATARRAHAPSRLRGAVTSRPLLNVDGGELDDEPLELYALADVVHVACGGHAGDDASMERVTRACATAGTRVGAHPSYEDREGFGRRARDRRSRRARRVDRVAVRATASRSRSAPASRSRR